MGREVCQPTGRDFPTRSECLIGATSFLDEIYVTIMT